MFKTYLKVCKPIVVVAIIIISYIIILARLFVLGWKFGLKKSWNANKLFGNWKGHLVWLGKKLAAVNWNMNSFDKPWLQKLLGEMDASLNSCYQLLGGGGGWMPHPTAAISCWGGMDASSHSCYQLLGGGGGWMPHPTAAISCCTSCSVDNTCSNTSVGSGSIHSNLNLPLLATESGFASDYLQMQCTINFQRNSWST